MGLRYFLFVFLGIFLAVISSAQAATVKEIARNILFGENGAVTFIRPTSEGGIIAAFQPTKKGGAIGVAKFNEEGDTEWLQAYANPGENLPVDVVESVNQTGKKIYTFIINSETLQGGLTFWFLQADGLTGEEISRRNYDDLPYFSKYIRSVRVQPDGALLIAGAVHPKNEVRGEAWISEITKEGKLKADFHYPASQLGEDHEFDLTGMFVDKNSDNTWTLVADESDRGAKGVWFAKINPATGKFVGEAQNVEPNGDGDCGIPFIKAGVVTRSKKGDYLLTGHRYCPEGKEKPSPRAWLFGGDPNGKRIFESLDRDLEIFERVTSISTNARNEIILSGMRVRDKELGGFVKTLFPNGIVRSNQIWDSFKKEPFMMSDAVQDANGTIWTGGNFFELTTPTRGGTVLYRIAN